MRRWLSVSYVCCALPILPACNNSPDTCNYEHPVTKALSGTLTLATGDAGLISFVDDELYPNMSTSTGDLSVRLDALGFSMHVANGQGPIASLGLNLPRAPGEYSLASVGGSVCCESQACTALDAGVDAGDGSVGGCENLDGTILVKTNSETGPVQGWSAGSPSYFTTIYASRLTFDLTFSSPQSSLLSGKVSLDYETSIVTQPRTGLSCSD